MDKDTLIKIGNLLVKVLTPIVDAEREKAAEARARAHAAEADFRRTHCQLCYRPRSELDLDVAHGVVCAPCLDRCARTLLERRTRLREQQRELDGLIAQLGGMFSDERTPATEGLSFADICEQFPETNPTGSSRAPKHATAECEPTTDAHAGAPSAHIPQAAAISERLDAVERFLQFEELLTPGHRNPRGSA